MRTIPLAILLSLIAAISVNEAKADCVDEDHIYECRAADEEAEDLTCSECYPDGEGGKYNCSCWTYQPELLEEEEAVYLTCQDAYMQGKNKSGVYTLKPDHLRSFKAYCDMETDGGGWTVIQRRMDGSVDFYLNWADYIHGFGNVGGEYWIGLSKLHRLANSSMPSRLRVDLENFANYTRYAMYNTFYIGGPSTDYQLHVTGYSGNAGNGMSHNNGRQFSTKDNDNDNYNGVQCAHRHVSGWWHGTCTTTNLNGRYYTSAVSDYNGIFWYPWYYNYQSLKSTVMMIRASND